MVLGAFGLSEKIIFACCASVPYPSTQVRRFFRGMIVYNFTLSHYRLLAQELFSYLPFALRSLAPSFRPVLWTPAAKVLILF